MKAVNLLPPSDRPRAAAKAPANASVAVVVVLGMMLLAVGGWVITKNQVNGKRGDIAKAQQEKAAADQRTQGLQAFGDFSQIKQTRVQSITELATKRFDWERFMRELALVLPDKVWISNVAAGGEADAAAASGPAPAAGALPTATAAGRSIGLTGCGPSQKSVAETIVRLRSMQGVEEVDLKNSARASDQGTPSGGTPDSNSDSGEGCGRQFQFNASVTFGEQAAESKGKAVRTPSRLGGGA